MVRSQSDLFDTDDTVIPDCISYISGNTLFLNLTGPRVLLQTSCGFESSFTQVIF